ncbi:MAG: hypothetical protein BIFFINMI_01809 [Phycisphaerae bacterium]|nr:hypothetical protein [Phycisphaerae bacterium]
MTTELNPDGPPLTNRTRFDRLADVYDRARPTPPERLLERLSRYAGGRPGLVVDLGCGTGLSTRIWSSLADRVIGIEPSEGMRRQAAAATDAANVEYRDGISHRTNLADNCADVVTCSQALHWMEAAETFAEAARILRAGGVFAAYDHDWPPSTGHWRLDAAWADLLARTHAIETERGLAPLGGRADKNLHLTRMRESGCFVHVVEFCLDHVEPGDAARLRAMVQSYSGVNVLLRSGVSEEEVGITRLIALAGELFGGTPEPWAFTYRVRMGIAPGR